MPNIDFIVFKTNILLKHIEIKCRKTSIMIIVHIQY